MHPRLAGLAFIFSGLFWIFVLALAGCWTRPASIVPAVVAPTGPATAAVAPAINESDKAHAAALSKAAAAAGAIKIINAGQPAGALTVGVENEASLIQTIAGPPSADDEAAAAKRALIVKEGDLAKISAQYQRAQSEVESLRASLAAAEQAKAAALSAAQAEQAALQAKYKAELERISAEANARVDAAALKAKADMDARLNFWLQIGSFGLGVLFCIGAVAAAQFAAAAPFLGPNIIRCLWAIGAGLIALGLLIRSVDRFIDAHPYLFYGLLIGVAIALIGAAILAWSNHHHAQTAS